MLLVKALEARKKQEEKERMREAKKNERRIEQERRLVNSHTPFTLSLCLVLLSNVLVYDY